MRGGSLATASRRNEVARRCRTGASLGAAGAGFQVAPQGTAQSCAARGGCNSRLRASRLATHQKPSSTTKTGSSMEAE